MMSSQTGSKASQRKNSTKSKIESANVYDKLKDDHRKVEKLFKTILSLEEKDAKLREISFQELKHLLEAHASAEEEIFYPITEKSDSTQLLTLEAYEEHKIAKTLLAEIEALQSDDEVWSAKIKVLSEVVKHHVKEEEGELFPLAKKLIGRDEAKKLGEEIKDFEGDEFSDHTAEDENRYSA